MPPGPQPTGPATTEATQGRPSSKLETLLSQYNLTLDHFVLLSIYPLTTIIGQLVQWFESLPTASYFSSKRNLINVVFVKRGWFWVSVLVALKAYELATTTKPASSSSAKNNNTPTSVFDKIKYLLLRYGIATLWWFIFSQWFLGPPLMDRVFTLTGGACTAGAPSFGAATATGAPQQPEHALFFTSATCKRRGGVWAGGIDPSGHMFLLSHGSLFLWFEILLPALNNLSSEPQSSRPRILSYATQGTIALLAVFWWMMLMTNIYNFHSFLERIAGLAWGYVEIFLVYIAARQIPALQFLLN